MESIVACPSCGTRNRLRPVAEGTPRCPRCKAALPWIVEAGEADFDDETRASVPVVVDFWAPWCAPCRMVSPVLDEIARDRAGELKLVKVNVDDAPSLGARHGAMSIPLIVVLRDGREVERVVGALPKRQLEARLSPALA